MIVAGTGHRPNKLGGYSVQVSNKLKDLAADYIRLFKPIKIISGMALGWDTALALAALEESIPLIAAIPFKGQESVWSDSQKEIYNYILSLASEIVIVSEGGYSVEKMQVRNVWMVDNADSVIALWDGSNGGTANCIKYAKSKDKEVRNIWKGWLKRNV